MRPAFVLVCLDAKTSAEAHKPGSGNNSLLWAKANFFHNLQVTSLQRTTVYASP